MYNLYISFAILVDRAIGNSSGEIVGIFIKNRPSTIFGYLSYSLYGP